MDIVAQTITTYSAYCSKCGAHGPHKESEIAAQLAALAKGWTADELHNSPPYFYGTFCPLCTALRQEGKGTD